MMVETNHDLCYACSSDGGKTWQKSNGETYNLPIREANAEYACRIPQNSELINQTSMSADTEGHPYIVTYWRDTDSTIPQYRLVWHDGINWHNRPIMNRTQAFSLKGGGTKMIPISRPRIAVDKGRAFFLFRDAERGSKVSMAYTADLKSGEWQVTDLTDFSVDAWEPVLIQNYGNKTVSFMFSYKKPIRATARNKSLPNQLPYMYSRSIPNNN